jgi:adenylate kinase family enzyme
MPALCGRVHPRWIPADSGTSGLAETVPGQGWATERRPKVEARCDRCEGGLFQREDDRPEAIKVRLEAYDRSTAPLIEFYRKAGLLLQVSAIGTPEEIYERTVPELEVRRLTQFAEQMWAAAEDRRSGL